MRPISDVRRARLRQLIAEHGKPADFARHTGKDRRQISAWMAEPGRPGQKNLSDVTARELERECGKPPGWLDHERGEDTEPSRNIHGESRRQSQLQRMDRAKMRDAMTLLRHLADLQDVPGLVNDPDAIAIAYDFLVEFDTPLSESNVLDITKRLAAKIRGENGDEPERTKTA